MWSDQHALEEIQVLLSGVGSLVNPHHRPDRLHIAQAHYLLCVHHFQLKDVIHQASEKQYSVLRVQQVLQVVEVFTLGNWHAHLNPFVRLEGHP